jgi:hypothetical protein
MIRRFMFGSNTDCAEWRSYPARRLRNAGERIVERGVSALRAIAAPAGLAAV